MQYRTTLPLLMKDLRAEKGLSYDPSWYSKELFMNDEELGAMGDGLARSPLRSIFFLAARRGGARGAYSRLSARSGNSRWPSTTRGITAGSGIACFSTRATFGSATSRTPSTPSSRPRARRIASGQTSRRCEGGFARGASPP